MILVILGCLYFVSLFLPQKDKHIQLTCMVAEGTWCLNILFKVEAGERIRAALTVEGPFCNSQSPETGHPSSSATINLYLEQSKSLDSKFMLYTKLSW